MTKRKSGKFHPFFRRYKNVPEVIAHRGGAGERPGETIYAFKEAVKTNVDILEMDIRFTSGEDLVLMHNKNVWETTGENKKVKKLTSEEIKKLDASFWWKKTGKVFPDETKLNVPRLEDVFKDFQGMRMNIEIKPFFFPTRLIEKFYRLIEKYEMTDKVLIASAWHRHLCIIRDKYPKIATSASLLEMANFRAFKRLGYVPDCDAIQLSSKLGSLHFITEEYIEIVKRKNLKVHGWTINEPEEMGRLISLGIDGIITDYPTTLLELLGRLSLRDEKPSRVAVKQDL